MDYVIEAENIGCVYLQESTNAGASKQVSGIFIEKLKIPSFGVTAVIGPSGSGKSTLVGLVFGLREENAGYDDRLLKFEKSGRSYSILESQNFQRGDFGFIFQEPQLLKSIPAHLNIEMAAHSIGRKIDLSLKNNLAKKLQVSEILFNDTGSLSGGQAQRIACLRALIVTPEVLICDEPTSSLDQSMANQVLTTMRSWVLDEQKAMVWITHNIEQAAEFADHIIYVNKGTVACNSDGSPFTLVGLSKKEKLNTLTRLVKTESPISNTPSPPKLSNSKENKNYITSNSKDNFLSLCFSIAVSEIYRTSSNLKKGNVYKRILNAFSHSMTWTIVLGIVVFFALFSLWSASNNYFSAQFRANPPHFTFRVEGDFDLNTRNLRGLEEEIRRSALNRFEEKFIFGRREYYLQEIWLPNESGCAKKAKYFDYAPMMVFNEREPIFLNAFAELKSQQTTLENPYIFADKNFRNVLDQLSKARSSIKISDQDIGSICINFHGVGVEFSIVHSETPIPGGSDRIFFIAMAETFYRDTIIEINPTLYKSNFYHYSSVYFDQNSRKDVLCSFGDLTGCAQPVLVPPELKLDKDSLNQIDSLLFQSYVSKLILTLLIVSFMLVITMSTTLAISAFVFFNEKTLAVLKAFGASTKNLLLILTARTMLLFINAIFLASLICFLGRSAIINFLSRLSNSDNFDFSMGMGIQEFLLSGLVVGVILLVCESLVVSIWASKNKYVGTILQEV